mgnify:CR=1 FL=1|tara:strand:- start:199 stop:639 length:441 start_codon:yes stop_codon:yes gene_type:complete
MKVTRLTLQRIIKEEIKKVKEGIADLNLSGRTVDTTFNISDIGDSDSKSKKKSVKRGMTRSAARDYGKAFLRKEREDPNLLKNHRGYRNFINDHWRSDWVTMKEEDIQADIEEWIKNNVLTTKKKKQPKVVPKPKSLPKSKPPKEK